ncbi:MAG: NAD(P)/FAD-dependent oxidoreductase [Nitrospinae bacterium]|nr:NAD(P)/FAD-dependent oxidoreductase [Nitrospinota bacterium]
MKYDAIVIGGGLGGLTAGARLAKAGLKVLLLEQNSTVGGCAATFKRKGFLMEAGLHEMDGLGEDDIKLKIFKEIGIWDKMKFVRVPEFYRLVSPHGDFVMPDNAAEAERLLIEKFPSEREGIRKFFRVMMNMTKWMGMMPTQPLKFMLVFPFIFPFMLYHVFRFKNKNVGDFVDSLTKDEWLKLILLANSGYYHDDPYELGMIYFCVAQGSYFTGGGHFIKGGSKELAEAMAEVITGNGGEVLTRHEATRIVVENGKATGVRYRKVSKTHQDAQEEIWATADHVVVNAPLPVVLNELMPGVADRKFTEKIAGMSLPGSAFSVYIGFRRPVKELGNRHYSTFVQGAAINTIRDFAADAKSADFATKSYVFVDYSQLDSALAPDGKGFGAIVAGDNFANWKNLSHEEYSRKKRECAETLIERLDKLVPGAKNGIEYYEAATPVTIKRFTRNPEGVFYGFAQTVGQGMMDRPMAVPGVSNVHVASAWGMPGGGFSGAIFGGYFASARILGK